MAGYLADNVDEWIYIDIADQHEDSMRFIHDCEKAIGKEIQILKSSQYAWKIASGHLAVSAIPGTGLRHVRTGSKRESGSSGKQNIMDVSLFMCGDLI